MKTNPFRPSNGTGGELFIEIECGNCKLQDDCQIISESMFYHKDDPKYPTQLVVNENGEAICLDQKQINEQIHHFHHLYFEWLDDSKQ